MENWFTYNLYKDNFIVRKGKGKCIRKSEQAVESYLERRYGHLSWDRFRFMWHSSEAAALKQEMRSIDGYVRVKGDLPPWNSVRGGGGGQTYFKCRAYTAQGTLCSNDALAGNYGFCGVHRR